ncbi:hypothetical protein ACLB2K_042833 [Fragaria x ananassa]
MTLQGIKGPSYRFIHGNSKEISSMQKEAMSRPKSLSHDIFSYVQPHFYLWNNTYGKKFLQWHGSQAQLVITEPELCKEVLNNKYRTFVKTDIPIFIKKLLGDGLVTTEGEKWGRLRKLANSAFHGESLKSLIPATIASTELMLESSYSEGKSIFDMLMKLSFLTFKNAFKARIPIISNIFKTSDDIEAENLEKGVRDSILEMVKKREQKAMTMSKEEKSFGSDFLGLLMKAHHDVDVNQRITEDDLVDECKTFYFAGQETANSLLAWTVFLLAFNTDWQEEERTEVLQLFGKQTPNPDGISKLKTMGMIINESLRLYPPVVSIERKVAREVRLGKLFVPADLEILIPALALQHDPKFWGQEAELFKPERFSEGVAKATNNNMVTFLPFGMGPRNCVGYNFAITEAKIALAMILQRHSFTLSPSYVHSPFRVLTVRPQHGVQVMLHSL